MLLDNPPEIATRDPQELKVEDRSLLKAIKLASQNNYISAVGELSKTLPTNSDSLSCKVLAIFKEWIQEQFTPAQTHLSPTKNSLLPITTLLTEDASPIAKLSAQGLMRFDCENTIKRA